MIGHGEAEKAFLEAWQGGRLHHAWLLAGPQGMGKGAFAARVARFLATHGRAGAGQAITLDDPGDAAAGKLVEAGNHPEIIPLARQPKDKDKAKGKDKDLARNIAIDQVRGVIRRLHLSLSLGDWRVIIVDAVDDLETDGANALLKTLEEPPAQTLFLLVSHSPGRLLPTIRSRCRILRFQPVEHDAMTSWLHDLRPMIDVAERRAIVAASGGVPGKALALIDSDVGAMEAKLLAIATSGDPGNRLREALAREVGGTSNRARLELVIDIVPGLLARLARERPIAEIAPVLAQWDRVQRTVRDAIRGSYDGSMVGFEIGNCLAELAPRERQAAR
ncbi:DNA-directed DNA polymerase [Sphingopyxis lindanitolerans]|uniref:DNA-directed DNA polymerase n=1 Tax=Sphingopyxis lindanitolerans TaxID=2054227 RepID=A0A2S8BB53_9SPHN|nr:DNA-directed DNA polymerase [Sphingopyxis lindanitolerans]